MIFGDSLSTSYGLPSDAGWVSLLTQRIHSKFIDYRVINASISGETALGGRNRIDRVLNEHLPEIVILELGANDGLRGASIKSIYENLEAIIKACKKYNALVLLAGMQLPPNYGISYTQKFQAIFPQLAENYQIKLIPFLLAGFGDKHDFFLADGIHPNEVAQRKIAENVWEILQTMFQENQAVTTTDSDIE
ncbi:MAG: arylesterase [Nitrosomonas sp.]|nr:MAG: arylesterase [Nitrosomonas sp.]